MSKGHALGASYRLVEQVGSGAAGLVWKAIDTRTEEVVAAKVLRAELATDTAVVERFVRERSILVGLQHRNLVKVRDLIVDGDQLGIVMDFVAGGSLRDVIDTEHTLAPALAADVAASVLAGLEFAHRRGVLHRDIKPDNVLLEPNWRADAADGAKVTDFGIAGMITDTPRTTTGLLGTPEYMSPELISAGTSGPATDIYGVGVLLYELLAGRTPFAGPGTDFTVAYRHVTASVPKIVVPPDLQRILDALLDKRPSARPSAAEAASALRKLAPSLRDVAALPAPEAPKEFTPSGRPATALRGVAIESRTPRAVETDAADTGSIVAPAEAPDLGVAANATRHRPLPQRPAPEEAVDGAQDATPQPRPWWRSRRAILAIVGAILILGGAVVLAVKLSSGGKDAPVAEGQAFEATQTDSSSPTGLTISRTAEYDQTSGTIRLAIRYASQNSVLQSPFLEVLPGLNGGTCPNVAWPDSPQKRNLSTATGMAVPCGWSVERRELPPQSAQEVQAEVRQPIASQEELQSWLDAAAEATSTAVSDPEVISTAYPAQRLQGVDVQTAPRVVSEKTVDVTLIPIWPSGDDPINPLYKSPSVGEPSTMLVAIAGGLDGIRFSDGCSGALSVSADGLTVTALSQNPACTVDATVGNFTNLKSAPFAIVTRGR